MELRIVEAPKHTWPDQMTRCSNAYCYAAPAWGITYKDKPTDPPRLDWSCNNHLIDFVTSYVNNMRIRLK